MANLNTQEEIMAAATAPKTVVERLIAARSQYPDLSVTSKIHKRKYVHVRVGYAHRTAEDQQDAGPVFFSSVLAETCVKLSTVPDSEQDTEDRGIEICLNRLGL
jgi:hypothetical protein